jgi:pimeloyl-ACP methyl ester carboxylesterase
MPTNTWSNNQMELTRSEPRRAVTDLASGDRHLEGPLIPDRTGSVLGLTRKSFHRIAFTDWGLPVADRPVLCVHGLTRNGRDFDYLAAALTGSGRRIVCPDLPGRGQSERLRDGGDYALPQYCGDMTVLIAALGATELDWVGTSLGGLIGMVLAALPNSPIRRIVINDIGPYLPWAGLRRLGGNLDAAPKGFETIETAERYFRQVLAPFGQLDDEHWRHLTTHSVKWQPERQRFEALCDPNIAHAFRNPWQYSVDLWKYWDAIDIPILVVRGQHSDLLPENILKDMLRRNRHATAHTVPNCGHAPALIAPDQIGVIKAFLNKNSNAGR